MTTSPPASPPLCPVCGQPLDPEPRRVGPKRKYHGTCAEQRTRELDNARRAEIRKSRWA